MSPTTLAVAAATIANRGVCPLTNERVLSADVVANAIGQMYSAGMNAYAGEWQFNVGIPSSSGSSGLMLLVIPNVCGLVIQSSKINESLVPLKGVEFAKLLTSNYRVNIFDQLVFGTVESAYDAMELEISNTDAEGEGKDLSNEVSDAALFRLIMAASKGDLETVQEVLRKGEVDVNQSDYDKRTALHIACSDGQKDVARVLLARGADPSLVDRWRQTPLDDARRTGSTELIEMVQEYTNASHS